MDKADIWTKIGENAHGQEADLNYFEVPKLEII